MVLAKFRKTPIKVYLPRRSNRQLNAKRAETPFKHFVSSKNLTNILNLPVETLIKIFSYFNTKELFYKIRPVCRKFRDISMSPSLWRCIDVENDIPTSTLKLWIKSAKLLKHFIAKHRNDGNCIAEEVSKCCRNLESIKLQNCWGSSCNYLLRSTPLCHLVTRCPKLYSFNFSQSRFMSCKFFRLISKDERNGAVMKRCNYTGPMNAKQMTALFNALEEYEVHDTATIGNMHLGHRFKLKDIVRYVKSKSSHNQIINELWENINYGGENRDQNNLVQYNDVGMDVDI